VKFTTVTIKEIQADKTHRLDAKYWIKKRKKENNKQATSLTACPRDDRIQFGARLMVFRS